MCCASDNHNYMCHTCAKEILNSNFSEAVIDKISNFHEICIYLKIDLVKTKCDVQQIITMIRVTHVRKEF